MSKKQTTHYCKILNWIRDTDSDFYGIFKELCLSGKLRTNRFIEGLTFLYPTDKAVRADIIKKTYSSEYEKATNILSSFIIPMALPNPSDFMKRPIGSILGVPYTVSKVEGNKKVFMHGIEIVPEPSFSQQLKKHSTAKPLYVYSITGKVMELPLDVPKDKFIPPRPKPTGGIIKPKIRGGVDGNHDFMFILQNIYDVPPVESITGRSVDINLATSMINYLLINNIDILRNLYPILDKIPIVSLYIFYNTGLVPTEITHVRPFDLFIGDLVSTWNGFFTEEFRNKLYNGIADPQPFDTIANSRNELASVNFTRVELIKKINSAYNMITVGTINPSMRLDIDYMRFMVSQTVSEMYQLSDKLSIDEKVNRLKIIMMSSPKSWEFYVMNNTSNVSVFASYETINLFVKSSAFLYSSSPRFIVADNKLDFRTIEETRKIYNHKDLTKHTETLCKLAAAQ